MELSQTNICFSYFYSMNWNTTNLADINKMCENTLMSHLKIEFTELDHERICAIMPVNNTTHQPMGLLHGGASVVLIESIASMGSALLCDIPRESPVGLEVNANHLSSIKNGLVKGIGKIIHRGKQTHVWTVDVFDNLTNKLIASGRITIMIVARK